MTKDPGVGYLWRLKADATAFLGYATLGYVVMHGLHVSGVSSGCHAPIEWAVLFGLVALLAREGWMDRGDGDE